MPTYPFIPNTTTHLAPGQFWSIPLSDDAARALVGSPAVETGFDRLVDPSR